MKIPKINFRIMTLEENIDIVKWAYYEEDEVLNVHDFTVKFFPELSYLDKNISKNEADEIISNVVKKYYEKNKAKIKQEIQRYSDLWKNYNDLYFEKLSNYLEVSWPDNLDVIDANVGLIPIFPRYLDNFSFSLSINLSSLQLIEICAHETLHFLWFEKWKNIHPETTRMEYDSPYLVWQYSEMVTDPILNNKPFLDIFDFEERGYDSFYEIYDDGELMMNNLRKIYGENITINEKIDNGFEYVKEIFERKNKSK